MEKTDNIYVLYRTEFSENFKRCRVDERGPVTNITCEDIVACATVKFIIDKPLR